MVLTIALVSLLAIGTTAGAATEEDVTTTTIPIDETDGRSSDPKLIDDSPSLSSPTTTVPQRPKGERPKLDRPERFVNVEQPGLVSAPGEIPEARVTVFDTKTGKIVEYKAPGEKSRSVQEGDALPGIDYLLSGGLYQTDHVYVEDNTTQTVYNVDLNVFVYERGCTDPETCNLGTGQRYDSGYVWFPALQVNLGRNPSERLYAMHAGPALGNGFNQWFFDWSGYGPPPEKASLGPGKGHEISLQAQNWYRIRIWRTRDYFSWNGAGYDHKWCWGAWIGDLQGGQGDRGAGEWCLTDAEMISKTIYWTEVAEPDPCDTDVWGVHNTNVLYRDPYWPWTHAFEFGDPLYEDTCPQTGDPATSYEATNIACVRASDRYTISDRETPRLNYARCNW